MSWHLGLLAGFDTETTGVDVTSDRIVTAALVVVHGSQPREARVHRWLVDPGVEIPEAATAVHGITTERARTAGIDAAAAVEEIAAAVAEQLAAGTPLIGWNVVYDLSLLHHECRRHGVATVEERLGGAIRPVVDGLVCDKRVDRYRRGSRRLVDVAGHYGVRLDAEDAHGAEADALAATRVVWHIANRFPEVGDVDLGELHDLQVAWAAEQAASFRAYRQRRGEPFEDIDGAWPLRRAAEAVAS